MKKLRIVPELRQKYSLLVNSGHFADRRQIAETLGRSVKTIESWHDDGSDGFTPGLVSAQSYRMLVELFRRAVGKYHTMETSEVEALIMGPARALAPYLQSDEGVSLLELFRREGIPDAGRVDTPKIELARKISNEEPTASAELKTGLRFCLIFASEFDGAHTLAMQHWQQEWGFIESRYVAETNAITLPDTALDGYRGYMKENDWVGHNLFLVVQTAAPIPPDIADAIALEAKPDWSLLKQLTDFIIRQPRDQRELFLMRIEFVSLIEE